MTRLLLTTCFSCAIAVPAFAQDPDAEGLSTPTPVRDIVTVFDQRVRLSDRAETISLVPFEETRALAHPAEVLNAKAGVNIHRGSGQEHLTAIRSPVLTGGAGAGSFLYLENGVPLRAAGFANVNGLFEAGTDYADQVEVFKGPGPAEYGSNAVHGLVNIVTPAPGSGNRVTLLGSSRGYGRLTVGHDVTDDFRATLSLAHDDGFRDDSGFDQQKVELRYRSFLGDWDVDAIAAFTNLNQETAGFLQTGQVVEVDGQSVTLPEESYRFRDLITTNAFPEAFRDGKNYRAQVNLSRPVGQGLTLELTPYVRRAELRFLRHFVPGQALEKNGHTSVGGQSALIGEDWSVGFDAEYTDGFLYEFQENPSRFSFVQGLHFDYEIEAIVVAGYAQKSWQVSDRLRIDVGARGEYTRYDYDTLAEPGTSGRFIRSPDRTDDFFTLTPKLGAVYDVSDTTSLFARAARGSRSPQTTDLYAVVQNQEPGQADVETLDSLEAGFRWAHGNAQVELVGFTMWKDNFFFRNADGFNVVDGKTRHTGAELSWVVPIMDRLSWSGEFALTDQTYAFDDPSSGIVDGLKIDTAPDTLGTMRVAYTAPRWDAGLEWRHVGQYFTDPANTQDYPGHDIFVARGGVALKDSLRLFARIDNLFDTRYADRADFAFGNERYFPGRPRTVFVGLTGAF